jgi:hypothetical protein
MVPVMPRLSKTIYVTQPQFNDSGGNFYRCQQGLQVPNPSLYCGA